MANATLQFWLWKPRDINWWIATLFMVGSVLFALGCSLFLTNVRHEFLLDSVFFAGSLFFTSAAYCQLRQSFIYEVGHRHSKRSIALWASLSQFIGTLLFNLNTFDAFFDLGWIAQDLLVWTPDITGSVLFQISGTLALIELNSQKKQSARSWNNINWWIGSINFVGCAAFLFSAVLAFVVPYPVSSEAIVWSTIFTLIGAICFFIGAYLMWPQMASNQKKLP